MHVSGQNLVSVVYIGISLMLTSKALSVLTESEVLTLLSNKELNRYELKLCPVDT